MEINVTTTMTRLYQRINFDHGHTIDKGNYRQKNILELEIRARNNPSPTLQIKSLENPSNNDKFSKFSKTQILLTITGRGHAIKKIHTEFGRK